jgi:hypothetical protein
MSELWVTNLYNQEGDGAPNFPNGAIVTGVATATNFKGDLTGTASLASNLTGTPNLTVGTISASGNVSIGGTLTYEDVTNIDSVGLITARSGIKVTSGNIDITSGGISGYNQLGATFGTTVTYTVKVIAKTAAHRYNGSGSSNGYTVDGVESPYLTLTPGRTYKFDQADGSNASHPIKFYLNADKTGLYEGGVTVVGTAGNAGAYTQIVVNDYTPTVLHYQCVNHAYMGNAVNTSSNSAMSAESANVTAMGANSVDCRLGNYFTKTITGATTFTFDNPPSSGVAFGFVMEVTLNGSNAITWPGTVKWPADTAPTITDGKTQMFVFITDNGGSRWRGSSLVDYTN